MLRGAGSGIVCEDSHPSGDLMPSAVHRRGDRTELCVCAQGATVIPVAIEAATRARHAGPAAFPPSLSTPISLSDS